MITPEQIPSFPPGWKILDSFELENDPRAGVVLCEREVHREYDCNWVTWRYNRLEGGCFWGHYKETHIEAMADFGQRIQEM